MNDGPQDQQILLLGQIVSVWNSDTAKQHGDIGAGPYIAFVTNIHGNSAKIDCTVMPPMHAPYPLGAVPYAETDEEAAAAGFTTFWRRS